MSIRWGRGGCGARHGQGRPLKLLTACALSAGRPSASPPCAFPAGRPSASSPAIFLPAASARAQTPAEIRGKRRAMARVWYRFLWSRNYGPYLVRTHHI